MPTQDWRQRLPPAGIPPHRLASFQSETQITATRIQRDIACYTADQLDHMQAQIQRDLDRMILTPSQSPGGVGH